MKYRKFFGAILIILGIAIVLFLTVGNMLNGYRLWSTNDSGKAEEFPTFIEYCWNFYKMSTVLAFGLGAIPFSIGLNILKKK